MLKIAWDETYHHPLPKKHRFPMEKYSELVKRLINEKIVDESQFFKPSTLSEKAILSVHKNQWWRKLKNLELTKSEERRTGFPLSQSLIERETLIAQGTVEATLCALQYGAAMNIAGGTHHAGPDFGEGFCLLNDIAIAAQYLIDQNLAKQILVVDLDVHQGNGTALIFKNDPRVFTFSMHGARNFPFHKEKSDLDIGLEDQTEDEVYLSILRKELPRLIELTQADFILYQAGVDVLESDKIGRLALTIEGCEERDRIVFEQASIQKIPIVTVMGGGYSEDLDTIVKAHINTYKKAIECLKE